MNKILLKIFLLSLFQSAQSQNTFNLRLELAPATRTWDVWETPDGFLTLSQILDTNKVWHYPMLAATFDNSGTLLLTKEYYLPDEYSLIVSNANTQFGDSIFLATVQTQISDTTYAKIIWFNEFGDTLQSKLYSSAYITNIDYYDWMFPNAMSVGPDNCLFLASTIIDPELWSGYELFKISTMGNEIWHYVFNTDISLELCESIVSTTDGGLIGAGGFDENGAQGRLFMLDDSGNEVWSFENVDEYRGYIHDIFVEDVGIIAATDSWDGSVFGFRPSIVKMPFDFNVDYIWTCNSDGIQFSDQWNYHLAKAEDGGYVSLARRRIPQDGFDNWEAWLMKVSATGELEWERFFDYLEDTGDGLGDYIEHIAYDFKSTSDGGFIFCGEATEHNDDIPGGLSQQGWLVKVDACGCLVPGCDVDCTIGVNETEKDAGKYFIYGPNPVSQYLNVYFFEDNQNAELCIYDMTGKQIEAFVPRTGKTTYMVYVEDYASGSYILNLVVEGQVIQTEKIVVD
jgi:hypothetical protein